MALPAPGLLRPRLLLRLRLLLLTRRGHRAAEAASEPAASAAPPPAAPPPSIRIRTSEAPPCSLPTSPLGRALTADRPLRSAMAEAAAAAPRPAAAAASASRTSHSGRGRLAGRSPLAAEPPTPSDPSSRWVEPVRETSGFAGSASRWIRLVMSARMLSAASSGVALRDERVFEEALPVSAPLEVALPSMVDGGWARAGAGRDRSSTVGSVVTSASCSAVAMGGSSGTASRCRCCCFCGCWLSCCGLPPSLGESCRRLFAGSAAVVMSS